MPVSLPPLTREESDRRYELLQRRSVQPVTFYANNGFNFAAATPYVSFSYTIPSYSGLAFVASNLLQPNLSGGVLYSLQIQLSLASVPTFTDNTEDQGNILLCAHGQNETQGGTVQSCFDYVYRKLDPYFFPLQTGTNVYLHYVIYPVATVTLTIVHRLVMGLVQTGLQT